MNLQMLLCSSAPRLDVGAFYSDINIATKRRLLGNELLLDVDFTKFCNQCDHVKKIICEMCWNSVMPDTILFLFSFLTKQFRIKSKDIQFFFSGGKGFHCWIFDLRFLHMTNKDRTDISREIDKGLHIFLIKKGLWKCFNDNLEAFNDMDVLDMNVTTNASHLIRLPFTVHNRTSMICAPLDLSNLTYKNCSYPMEKMTKEKMDMLVGRTDHLFT